GQVVLRRPPRRKLRSNAFDFPAIFEVVGGGLAVLRDEIHHGRSEDLADDVGDMRSTAGAGDYQLARFKLLQRIAHDGAGHVELPRKLALARKSVPGAYDTFQDQHLDLLDNIVGS